MPPSENLFYSVRESESKDGHCVALRKRTLIPIGPVLKDPPTRSLYLLSNHVSLQLGELNLIQSVN